MKPEGRPRRAAAAALEGLDEEEIRLALASLSAEERATLADDWPSWAHGGQLPADDEWRVWVLLAGRGFGKTRAGAEWVSAFARDNPGASIALVGANPAEARAVMVEGRSGLLAVARAEERSEMRWEPSRRRLAFASGAEAFLYSAANPESLRGPEHHAAWCDELAKWRRGMAAWDNLRLGLRAGERPRALVTTTPRVVPVLKRILSLEGTVLTGGATRDNPHMPADFVAAVEAAHKGTRFGRQELEGVLVEDVEGALWTRAGIERARVTAGGEMRRIVVGVDPPASSGGTCGIVVCGLARDGAAHVLADCSASGLSPEGWARKVAAAAAAWGAHRVVAEKNNGGEMVAAVLRGADCILPGCCPIAALRTAHAGSRPHSCRRTVWYPCSRGETMKVYTYSEARQNLATLLEQARREGSVRIRRRDGQSFVLKPETALGSPLDVEGIDLNLTKDEIVAFVREGRRGFASRRA